LNEQPSARLTALTSGCFSGSHQATRFEPAGLPLKHVALSVGMKSSQPSSLATPSPSRKRPAARNG